MIQTQNNRERALHVLLLTEGTYPFHWGGVSTWCHLLISDLPEVRFTLLSLAANPWLKPQFTLPANVVEFRPVPLWGIRESLETWPELTLPELRRRKRRTTEAAVSAEFIPGFGAFLRDLFASDAEPKRLGTRIHQMYRFFQAYDFDAAMRSRAVWDCFAQTAQAYFPATAARHGYPDARFDLSEVTMAMHWLYHWLIPLATALPPVDVAHASTAGICGMIGVVAKLEHGAGFMLTEHGIYLRERYLAEAASSSSLFHKLFNLRFARRMTDLSYALADQISPCCDYNQRWEIRNGVAPDRLRTIYYGADAGRFSPAGKPVGEPPVVVWVGRINPLKDLITLLRAAALVHQARPDIQFRLYGSAGAEEKAYHAECLALHADLGLEDVVIFAGYASNPADAYNEGDVVVLSSISEGFPFATLEAMLCGKPIVATAVGGLPEQIDGCGIAVEPRNPEEMAQAILTLMNDPIRCAELGRIARETAVQEFSVRQSGDAHVSSYMRLSARGAPPAARLAEGEALHLPPDAVALEVGGAAPQPADLVALAAPVAAMLVRPLVAGGMPLTLAVDDNFRPHGAAAGEAQHDAPLERAVGVASAGSSYATVSAWGAPLGASAAHAAPNDTGSLTALPSNGYPRPAPAARRRRNITTSNGHTTWTPRDPAAIDALAEEVIRCDAQPIDYLEVTAVLESLGITDDVAANRYGAPHTFGLAETVLERIRAGRSPTADRAPEPQPNPPSTARQILLDYLRGPLSLIPGVVLLLIIEIYRWLGQWQFDRILALSVGLTSSMLLTNGFIQATTRRGALYFAIGNMSAASQFLRKSLSLAGACLASIAGIALLAATWLNVLAFEDRVICLLAFMAISAIWLTASVLVFRRAQVWLGAALAAGLLAGVAADRLAAPFLSAHLAVGTAVGFSATMAVLLRVARRIVAVTSAGAKLGQVALPAPAYLIHEAAPYFAYGTLYTFFIFVPHLIGWVGALAAGQQRIWAILSLEGGFTLALPPLMLASGVAERAMRLFWQRVRLEQSATPGHGPDGFGRRMVDFYRQQRRHYLAALTLVSVVADVVIQYALGTQSLRSWIGIQDQRALVLILRACLVTYWLLGWGLFNCMFTVTLAQPTLALRAVLLGMAATIVVGVPLSLGMHFSYATIGFSAGALVFCIASSRATARMLQSADYYYYSAL